ncbi:triose-phosphate transporter family-domain-containing protein [Amylostereum chailletii]|nr:triose-phosphate transporter family-domain-containing protein [Amylostereum chailletii]
MYAPRPPAARDAQPAWRPYIDTSSTLKTSPAFTWQASPALPTSAVPTSSSFPAIFFRLRSAIARLLPAINDPRPLTTAPRRNLRPSLPSLPPAHIPLDLPNPATVRFVLLCALWYSSSALSSNTGKSILIQFRYPITLTFVQFAFVAAYCLLFMSPLVPFSRLRRPTRQILRDTLPMGLFQVGGHIFSSMAMSRIPVSTVHTIKALSPLFTVAAYALMFGVRYSAKTYISLLPLTFGVMLACSFDVSASNGIGLLCAFGSALVFVSSNIFFKKIMPTSANASQPPSAPAQKLDKLNLLFYSSGMAFLFMIPIWASTDLPLFLAATPDHISHPAHGHSAPHSTAFYMLMNGTVHFAQNIIAFVILASVSPVTYSIASLIKRVAVICIAIVWFAQRVHPVQAAGIALTFVGLWMYNGAKGDVERGEKKRRGVEARREGVLPLTGKDAYASPPPPTLDELNLNFGALHPETTVLDSPHARPHPHDAEPTFGRKRERGFSNTGPGPNPTPSLPRHKMTTQAQNLFIDVPPPRKGLGLGIPADSYPSPPASIDSPPLTAQLMPISVRA